MEAQGEEWGPVRCTCGGLLAEAIDDTHVVIDGIRLPFRRSTDHLTCSVCTRSYPVVELRRARARAARRERFRRRLLRTGSI